MTDAERNRLLEFARDRLLREFPDAWALYVYGSFARGEEWPGSDIDLAVLLPPDQRITDILAVTARMSQVIGRDVDLVDVRRVGDLLRREVLADGKTLFVSSPGRVLAWEAMAMSRYAHHRREVGPILEQFRRTGTGYSA